jgi:hypothetical protein
MQNWICGAQRVCTLPLRSLWAVASEAVSLCKRAVARLGSMCS